MSEPPPDLLLAGPLVSRMTYESTVWLITFRKFVGVILNWALLGALMIQIYDYHSYFRKTDRRAIKFLVHFVSVLELVQTGFITHTAWWHLVQNWGKPNGLLIAPWTSTYVPILNGLASASVQGFFAWRIWLFETKSTIGRIEAKYIGRLTAGLIILTALMQFSAAVWVAVEFVRASRNIANTALIGAAAETWLVGSFVCDLLITITMVIILLSARRKTSSKSTMFLLNNLIINTIETGAITAVLALTQLVLYKLYPTDYMHVTVEFVLGRLYSNVLLATLNGRHRETGRVITNFHSTIKFQNETEMNPFPGERMGWKVSKDGGANVETSSTENTSSSQQAKDTYSKGGLC
ncbi:hypothetical protein MVEN_02269600 [Mycena venus]|uniref:DUF6534 domain-containing protein n=1 Tax=Mycena venus TaxID=2733690 RepID=A0A8H7CE96_9AGAR|nr:hypothetical protein MVEN_02269600 [Mycena venus]